MPEKIHCDICNMDFKTKEEKHEHEHQVHPEMDHKHE